MVAYLNFTKSYARSLNYNETKVRQGKAAFIHAENFLIDKSRLTVADKRTFLKRLSDMNKQLKCNALHAKLMFHPDEHLSDAMLAGIADRYMALTGFKDQPYLVYRHDDAGEQHIHIVSSLISESGKKIEFDGQPWAMSVQAAQSIEKEFGLNRVAEHRQKEYHALKAELVRRVKYGEKNIIQSVDNVLKMVTQEYKFSSMEELNALLRSYNLYADKCQPGSHTYKHNGLYYRVLDEQGKNCCTPVKSSMLGCKPTLKNLEKKFMENRASVQETIPFIKSRIDWILLQEPGNLKEFDRALKAEGIDLVIGRGEAKYPDLFYVDHQSRSVINGGTIGTAYSSEALFQKFPDPLRNHLSQVPHLLRHLVGHLPGSDDPRFHQQQEFRIRKQS